MDSLSVPSEPPDIRNWFASYVYESPELNTLDGFQDSDRSDKSPLEKKEQVSLSKTQTVNKRDDDLVAARVNNSLDELLQSKEHNGLEPSMSAAKVAGLSDSFPRLSEPPDIKNWFSSYLYESPALGTLDNFAHSDCKGVEDQKIQNAQRDCSEKKDEMRLTDVGQNTEFPCNSRVSAAVVNCTNFVKKTKQDNQSTCEDDLQMNLTRLSTQSHSTPQRVSSEHMLAREVKQSNNHGTIEEYGKDDGDGKGYNMNSACRSTYLSHKLLTMEKNLWDEKSLHKLTERNEGVEHNLEKEAINDNESPGTLDFTTLKGNSPRRPTVIGGNGKENDVKRVAEDGFISTRKKSRQSQTGNLRTFDSMTNGAKTALNSLKDATTSRKVLSETTNFHSPNIVEITGKWCCPQKAKPNLGPPLKQLRLEQWIRRT